MAPNQKRQSLQKEIRKEYEQKAGLASRLLACLLEQISALLSQHDIALSVPMEHRVKSWQSIDGKISRKNRKIKSISDITDLAGIRIITVFKRDVLILHNLIMSTFDIIEYEDTSERLGDNQFGYQSNHYIVRIPNSWIKIPSYSGLEGMIAEIQVRTTAQHIWASASHKLQYKQEESIPPPLRRAISRVSALLESADLELERVLKERDDYIDSSANAPSREFLLDVDVLSKVLMKNYPIENYLPNEENYEELLSDLLRYGIDNVGKLTDLINSYKSEALRQDKNQAEQVDESDEEEYERSLRGVFFTHCGLARISLGAMEVDRETGKRSTK